MAKWIIFAFLSLSIYLKITYEQENAKLLLKNFNLQYELDTKKCPKVDCPEFKPCVPIVTQLPCLNDCPNVECPECDRCPTWFEMCLEDE